jgi:parallel beta-helix repeat protein
MITGNDLGQSFDESLLVAVTAGGGTDYTVKNNKLHDAQNNDCVNIALVDTLDFQGNKAQGCFDSAFSLDVNDEPIVNNNTGIDASGLNSGATLELFCELTCDTGTVNGNKLDGGGNEADGLHVENIAASTPGLTINSNTVTNMTGIGIHLPTTDGGNNTLSGNTVQNAGDVDDTTFGIFIESNGNTLLKSNVSGSFDNGIEIAGDNNTLGDGTALNANQSHDNGEDGTHIASTADSTSMDTNNTKNNSGEGTEDDGTNSTITNNTSSGNRQDCAGTDGSGTYDAPPAGCADGSYFTDAGIILRPTRKAFGSIF